MIRRPPRSTRVRSSAASDVYKRQGTVDAWAEGFSAGARRPGDLMLMYGSTMFFVQVLSSMRTHRLLWTTAGVEPGSLTVAAGMSTSGTLTNWVKALTGCLLYTSDAADDLTRV